MSTEVSAPPAVRGHPGVNVVGYLSAELGVGEAARRMARAAELTGLPVHHVGITVDRVRHAHPTPRPLHSALRHRDTIYSLNADELIRGLQLIGEPRYPSGGRRFGYWFWEVELGLDHWTHVVPSLDEVWAPSEFVADALRPFCEPRLMPLPVWAPRSPAPFTRRDLGLPDGFVFLFCYDFHSVMERKNPLGLVDAYCRAFGPHDGASLVLKSTNGSHHPEQLAMVLDVTASRPDIHVMEGYVSPTHVQGLIEQADCFVSLHRSEGFGLNIANAMAAGRPVVATGYSGNMTFMDEASAFVVPYDLVEVGEGHGPYPAHAPWADPRLDAAAEHLRTVFDRPAVAAERAAAGRAHVLARQSIHLTADRIRALFVDDQLTMSVYA
jgi:glycosyltransferase involved in cell wall biosynthesis